MDQIELRSILLIMALVLGRRRKMTVQSGGKKASLESLSLEGTFKILCRERGRERPGIEEN